MENVDDVFDVIAHVHDMLLHTGRSKTYVTIKLNQTTLRLFQWHGKAKNQSHSMWFHASPELDL